MKPELNKDKIIEELTKEIEELRGKLALALNEIERLKSIIRNDSSNSSLPPSSTPRGKKAANEYNGRESGKRKAGGQKGHKGAGLTKEEIEAKIASGECRHEIEIIGDIRSGKYVTKYLVDLKVETVITEIRIYTSEEGYDRIPEKYRNDVTYGENIRALVVALYSEGVMSNDRIAAFLNMASNGQLALSEGSVYNFCRQFGEQSLTVVGRLEEEQMMQDVVCTDATTVSVNGVQCYIRNISTQMTVVYYAMQSKSIVALEKIRFFLHYMGTLVHDHETALYHFGLEHGECNVHIIRYLRKNNEDTGNKWSEEMICFLTEANRARKALIDLGETAFSEESLYNYEKRYFEIIRAGHFENARTPLEYARKNELALLNRLDKYSHNHLLFLHRFDVPFDDNMSERDLRKAKNRQKMAGGFRKNTGQEMYCAILSVIETAKRRKMNIIDTIKNIITGNTDCFQAVLS